MNKIRSLKKIISTTIFIRPMNNSLLPHTYKYFFQGNNGKC